MFIVRKFDGLSDEVKHMIELWAGEESQILHYWLAINSGTQTYHVVVFKHGSTNASAQLMFLRLFQHYSDAGPGEWELVQDNYWKIDNAYNSEEIFII